MCGDWQVGPPYGALQYGAVSTASKDVLMSIPMGVVEVAVDRLQPHVSCLRQDIWGE